MNPATSMARDYHRPGHSLFPRAFRPLSVDRDRSHPSTSASDTRTSTWTDSATQLTRTLCAQVRPNMSVHSKEFKWRSPRYRPKWPHVRRHPENMCCARRPTVPRDTFYYVRNNVIDARGFFRRDKQKLTGISNAYPSQARSACRSCTTGATRHSSSFSWRKSYKQIRRPTMISQRPSLLERARPLPIVQHHRRSLGK
jgi:hypothetical protein